VMTVIYVPIEAPVNIYSTAQTLYYDSDTDVTTGAVRIAVHYRDGLAIPVEALIMNLLLTV
jgi:hypothetical protein